MNRLYNIIVLIILGFPMLLAQDNVENITFIDMGRYLILKLPYEVNSDCPNVFEEDTPLAIDIIEIKADGNTLSFVDDMNSLDGRTYWKTNSTNPGQQKYFISMYWYKDSADVLRWNDGSGLILTEIEPGIFKPSTNSYELIRGMQYLEITYRIGIPDDTMPLESGRRLELKEENYSNINTVHVSLQNIWE